MLHQLVEYAAAQGIAGEAGFTPKIVRWLITFNSSGDFLGVVDLAGGDRKSKGRQYLRAPHLKFSGDTPMRQFLVDTAKFAVLLGEEPPSDDASESDQKAWRKLLTKRKYFLNLLRKGGEADAFLRVVADRLSEEPIRAKIRNALEAQSPKAKPTDNVTFAEVTPEGNRVVVALDHWHDWWRGYFPTLFAANEKTGKRMRCFLSGKLEAPARTHPKIKGLADVGGNAESILVGFNEPAFCSYGLKQSANSSISDEMSQQYAAGLNDLIAHRGHRLAGAKVVYWYVGNVDEAVGKDPLGAIINPKGLPLVADEEEDEPGSDASGEEERREYAAMRRARELLAAIRDGNRPELANARFCALTMSGNKARVVVEDWMEGQFEALTASVVTWFEDLQLVNVSGLGVTAPPPLERVVTCLLPERKPNQEYRNWIKPVKPCRAVLWKCAISLLATCDSNADGESTQETLVLERGIPIPDTIAQRVVQEHQRSVVNGEVAAALASDGEKRALRLAMLYARMGLMKAWLLRKNSHYGGKKMEPILKTDHTSSVYHFGRLVAVLADLQWRALRKNDGQSVKSSLVDRFYTAASTMPRLMLGRLTALSNHHLRKLEQSDPGRKAAYAIRRRIAEINAHIDDATLPSAALLEDQTLFALGYYQQIAHMNGERAKAAAEKKKSATPQD